MALPSSPPISMSQVKAELGISGTLNLTDSRVRTLFGIPSGTINLLAGLGKSAALPYKARPTAVSFAITGTNVSNVTHTNDASAYDIVSGHETSLDTTTYASLNCIPQSVPATTTSYVTLVATYSGFTGTFSYTSGQTYSIFLYLNAVTQENLSSDQTNDAISDITLEYSLNNGSSWNLITGYSGATSTGNISVSASMGTSLTMSSLLVRITMDGMHLYSGLTTSIATARATLQLYDIMVV